MAGEDYNKIALVLGKRGTGKTEYVKGNEALGLEGFIKSYLAKDMGFLIVDTFDHPSYQDVPVMHPEKLREWKGRGVYRTWVPDYDMPELCAVINETIWNCHILWEDFHKHQQLKLDKRMLSLISDSKQKNVDMTMMSHLWAKIPKDLYRYVDLIEIFKTKDHPSVREADMVGYYDDVVKAWNEVMKHPSLYFHKLVDTDL